MTNIDQFESVFKSADKTVFEPLPVDPKQMVVVTDLPDDQAHRFAEHVRQFLGVIDEPDATWQVLGGAQFQTVGELLQRLEQLPCDMVCLYRNLHLPAREHPYSLGVHVDVLTQATELPVLLTPRPEVWADREVRTARTVMAITDHLTGDHRLVSVAARFTPAEGRLLLAHVEDEPAYEKFIGVISRISMIDTAEAREEILRRLLREPDEFMDTVRDVLQQTRPGLAVEKIVALGHHLTDYCRLIDDHEVDLLVLNTKDEDQLAMHGLAYPLAVELRETPMLLL